MDWLLKGEMTLDNKGRRREGEIKNITQGYELAKKGKEKLEDSLA